MRNQTIVLLLTIALAIPLGQLALSTSTARAASDLLPDLRMALLDNFDNDIYIAYNSDGRRVLRFDSVIVNVGKGPFEVRGTRDSTTDPGMTTVTQRIYDDAGGYSDRPTDATMFYSGDGHLHWHVANLERTELKKKVKHGKHRRYTVVGTGIKRGFCFFDNTQYDLNLPGAPQSPQYTGCGNHQPDALEVTTGLSIGWGDVYDAALPDQYIDITGLKDGRYRLTEKADAGSWFRESKETNNTTYVDIQITGDTVSVIDHGPSA